VGLGRLLAGSVGVHVVCVGWGWWVLHARACSVSVETAESCGTAMSVAVTVPLPCATPTTTTPHTEIGPLPARDRSRSARPTRRRGTHDKLEGEGRMPHLRTIGEQQVRSSATDLDAKADRFRWGLRPISMRKRTDLGAGCDRSRCESGPISARVTTDLEPGYDRSRGGRRCRRLPVVVGGAGHGPVGRRQRRSIEHGDLFEAQALVEAP